MPSVLPLRMPSNDSPGAVTVDPGGGQKGMRRAVGEEA